MVTLRQHLIQQLREALHQAETPSTGEDCTICFTISETTFVYDVDDLDSEWPGE